MKGKIIIFIAIPIIAFLTGCNKSMMDLNPLSQISAPTFWKSQGDFDKGLTACYSRLQSSQFSTELPAFDCFTDNAYSQHNYGSSQAIMKGEMSPSTGGYQSGIYSDAYGAIARINGFLMQLGAYKGTDISDALRTQYMSEASFLRAFFYFKLYDFYGDVPLVLEPLSIENMIQPKVDAAKILAQIMINIDYAIAHGNTSKYYETNGRITVSAAKALKARILIRDAYPNGVADVAKLTQVRDLCNEVIPLYTLSPNFQDLFTMSTQKGNKEIIFSTIFLAPDNVSSMDLWYGDWYVVSPYQNFINDFECTDGLPWATSPLKDPANVMANRDPRLAVTVFSGNKITWPNGASHVPSNNNPTGYGLRKFLTPETIPYGYSSKSGQDWVQIRLGEVLLMFAEAENEINGPTTAVYAAMTTLRSRPSVNLPAYPAGYTKELMRTRIRHERRIELAFEGFRYFDLKRWKIAGAVINAITDGMIPAHWDDKFYKWPLPQGQIDMSKGILVQNPNY